MPEATIHPLNINQLLREYGLRPNKSLGQNFLVDNNALHKMVQVAELSGDDTVLEIGAGLGSLTRHLALAAREVVAVEIDGRLLPPLTAVLKPYANVRLFEGDILSMNPAELVNLSGYIVVANIPYYITSALIRHLLETDPKPARIILTVQREVARRICAEPGEMSILALSVQVYGQPVIRQRIPAGSFYPIPGVDSAVIRIDLYPTAIIQPGKIDMFFRLVKAGFSQKRKNLRNALSAGMAWSKETATSILQESGIDPTRRAETLSLDEWSALTDLAINT
jgi:16S rRNA (adenine1518-N6/adenine1519-N6)-dimethyltransferase